ncbi:MAG: 4Fe-4S dicluster domain-containing protein [Phycisphaerales bacterium]
MCPAYQATRDERTSTRGWGNTLRLAITGQLGGAPGSPAWADPDVERALGLCLSCKACKSECPSNVDIAKLKAEYLAQSHAARGQATQAARFYAGFDDALLWATRMPKLANRVAELAITRRLLHRFVGLDPRRSLPKLTKPLRRRWARRTDPIDPTSPTVVLLADAFTDAFEPQVGLATRRVLEAFGYHVELLHCGDLGRAKISVGMLGEAIEEIEVWLERFRPFLDHRPDVVGFVVCEPSCLSAIRDDWLELRVRTSLERRRRFADACFLPEQFIERHWDEHPRRPSFRVPKGRVVLHGHCHQRALWGVGSSGNLLARLFGRERLVAPETGCCGMAGSYGYDADKYDLSMRVAARNLVPTVELAGEGDLLAAAGTSCRHQIFDTTGRHALHPIEVVANALIEG